MVDVEKCPYIEYKIQGISGIVAKEEKSFSQISGLFEKNSKYEKENKEFYDDLDWKLLG